MRLILSLTLPLLPWCVLHVAHAYPTNPDLAGVRDVVLRRTSSRLALGRRRLWGRSSLRCVASKTNNTSCHVMSCLPSRLRVWLLLPVVGMWNGSTAGALCCFCLVVVVVVVLPYPPPALCNTLGVVDHARCDGTARLRAHRGTKGCPSSWAGTVLFVCGGVLPLEATWRHMFCFWRRRLGLASPAICTCCLLRAFPPLFFCYSQLFGCSGESVRSLPFRQIHQRHQPGLQTTCLFIVYSGKRKDHGHGLQGPRA